MSPATVSRAAALVLLALLVSPAAAAASARAIVCPPGTGPAAFYSSDLELDDGGWVASGAGAWEHGAVVPGVYQGCDTAPRPEPAGASSGTNVWATNLDGCYANAGAESLLTQTFDLSALAPPISLEWMHWYEVFTSFDMAEVYVNGALSFEVTTTAATPDYLAEAIDLSAFAGNPSVQVEFRLFATTVVNRMGWYLDDVEILYCTDEIFIDGFESGDTSAWSFTAP